MRMMTRTSTIPVTVCSGYEAWLGCRGRGVGVTDAATRDHMYTSAKRQLTEQKRPEPLVQTAAHRGGQQEPWPQAQGPVCLLAVAVLTLIGHSIEGFAVQVRIIVCLVAPTITFSWSTENHMDLHSPVLEGPSPVILR